MALSFPDQSLPAPVIKHRQLHSYQAILQFRQFPEIFRIQARPLGNALLPEKQGFLFIIFSDIFLIALPRQIFQLKRKLILRHLPGSSPILIGFFFI